ncbi:tyrosine--tRNA ligase [Candidatus Woesearchaeota archaeon]|nr:tyrosine--tRNA ligase [Candidatus Woesearchaeota archaeon]
MNTEERLELIRQVGEEIITEEDLRKVLEEKKQPIAYDGFEPSGRMHIAQGILRSINTNKMIKAGCKFKFLVADWHGWANNKMGGDLEKIKKVGEYLIEIWRACGMDLDNVEFVWASDFMNDDNYWKKVMNIARASTVKRILRCSQIMGRSESEALQASQIFYPCMQCADIFHLDVDICQLGLDQRKVNMLAREIGPQLGYWKPVIVSHHMLMGLGQPASKNADATERAIELKMSKSKPDTAIFMTDSYDDIKRKMNKAYCPEKITENNPIMEYARYVIFEKFKTLDIKRPEKYGGDLSFVSYDELAKSYSDGELHPMDLKTAVADRVYELVKPIESHFTKNKKAVKLKEEIESFRVTR